MKKIKEIIPYIIIIIIVVLIRTFLISPARVNGNSMIPTLYNKEIVLVNKYVHYFGEYKRFDIVVLKVENEFLVKRIIAFENETVKYEDDVLYINEKKVDTPIDFEYTKDFIYKVKPGEMFVLGDNRNVSKDSRYYGSFDIKDFRGTVNYVIFPFKKIGKVK